MLGLERDRISLHRNEGFSHLGAPGGLEGLPGDPIGLHETFGTLLKALGVAFRCYPGSKLRALRSREPEPYTARFQPIVASCCSKLLEPSRAEAAPSRGDSASYTIDERVVLETELREPG